MAAAAATGKDAPAGGAGSSGARDEYHSLGMVRTQHRRNLEALLRRAMLTGDYRTASGVAGTLLACQRESLHILSSSSSAGDAFRGLVLLLWSCLELLLQHGAAAQQVTRTMRKIAALLSNEGGMRQAVQLELALNFWAGGDVRQSLDLLHHELSRASDSGAEAFTYHLALLHGAIKHSEWVDQLLGAGVRPQAAAAAAAAGGAAARGSTAASRRQQRQQHQQRQMLGPLQAPLAVWRGSAAAAAGSSAGQTAQQDAAKQAERYLDRALKLCAAACLPALLRSHLLVVSGRGTAAVAALQAAVSVSTRAPELLSQLALLQQAEALPAISQAAANGSASSNSSESGSGSDSSDDEAGSGGEQQQQQKEGGDSQAPVVHSYVATCVEVLQADPWAQGAVQGLVQACGHCLACAAQAVRGLLAHLDAAALEPGAAAAGWSALAVPWSVLSVLLVQLASAAVLEASKPPGAGGSAAATGSSSRPRDTANALQQWQQLQPCLQQHCAWWQLSGLADSSELQPLQQLCRQQQQLPPWQQQQQRAGSGPGAAALLGAQQQLLCCKATVLGFVLGQHNGYSQAVLAALTDADNSKPGGGDGPAAPPAAPLSVAGARASLVDALALAARLQAWQQRQQQQQAPPKRQFGAYSPAFGALVDMPDAWWACFPHKRRRQQQQQQAAPQAEQHVEAPQAEQQQQLPEGCVCAPAACV